MLPSLRPVLAGALALGVVAAACGGAAAPTATPTKAPAPATAAPGSAPTPTRAAAAQPTPTARLAATPTSAPLAKRVPQGSLVYATGGITDEGAIDAGKFNISGAQILTSQMYDPLVTIDAGQPAPKLATAWRILPDGKSWEFDLRKGVKFQNGDPLTTDDVVFTFERMQRLGKAYGVIMKRVLTGVEAAGPDKFVVKTKDVYPFLLSELLGSSREYVFVQPKKYIEQVGDDEFGKKPFGSGPYKLLRRTIQDFYDFEAFPDYWAGPPYVKDIKLRIVPDESTRLAMLKTGEADISGVNARYKAALEPLGFQWLRSTQGGRWIGIQALVTKAPSPMLDKRVRQAMAHAINRQAIISRLLYGEAELQTGVYFPESVGYRKGPDPFPYDPEKAKRLLKEAGYEKGFETEIGYVPSFADEIEAIITDWAKVGIKVKALPIEFGTFWGKMCCAQVAPLFQTQWGFDADGHRPAVAQFRSKENGALFPHVDDPQMLEIINKESVETDINKRLPLLYQMEDRWREEAFYIPLYWPYGNIVASKRIAEWPFWSRHYTQNMEDIKLKP